MSTELADALARLERVTADLEQHIERRAHVLAEPLIAEAQSRVFDEREKVRAHAAHIDHLRQTIRQLEAQIEAARRPV